MIPPIYMLNFYNAIANNGVMVKPKANTAEGNKVLVDDCSLVPAFSNIKEEATNMLGQSIQRYTVEGKLFDQPSNYPGDHWSEVGAIMQKYLDKQIDRAEFAKEVQDYWTNLSE